jgi:hypothetical protein
MKTSSKARAWLLTLPLVCLPPAALALPDPGAWSAFGQAGTAGSVKTMIAGASLDWPWKYRTDIGTLGGYSEVSFGRWHSSGAGQDGTAWITQLGVTPVIRLWPSDAHRWFVEAGIGGNLLLPVFRTSEKRFSTRFNFGDHVAVGFRFGQEGQHEIALREQHFSNAGIREPNPGQNFTQIRYAYRF